MMSMYNKKLQIRVPIELYFLLLNDCKDLRMTLSEVCRQKLWARALVYEKRNTCHVKR